MDSLAHGIMNSNTLIYSIFFGIMLIFAVYLIVKFFVVNKNNLSARHWVPLILTAVIFAYSFEQISWGHFYKLLGFNMFIFYALVAYLYAGKIDKRKCVKLLFWFLFGSSIFMMIASWIIPSLYKYVWVQGRFAGILGNANSLQICLIITLACVFALFYKKAISRPKMYFQVFSLVSLGLLTKSKTFILLLIVMILIYVIYEFIWHTKIAIAETIGLFVIIGVVYFAWGKNIIQYFYERIVYADAGSFINGFTTYRWDMWLDYLGDWSENVYALLFGKGFSSPDFVSGGTHNDYVFLLYNFGIVGTVLCLALAVTYIVYANKKHTFVVWNALPIIIALAVSCAENLLIRVFSLLTVLATMFVFDGEDYGKKKTKLSDAKVLVIVQSDDDVHKALPVLRDLIARGANVDCVCGDMGKHHDKLIDEPGLALHYIEMSKCKSNIYYQICRLQRENKYNLVYCCDSVGGVIARLIGHKYNLPVIYMTNNLLGETDNKFKKIVQKEKEHVLSYYTDALIVSNDDDYVICHKWPTKYKYKVNSTKISKKQLEEIYKDMQLI